MICYIELITTQGQENIRKTFRFVPHKKANRTREEALKLFNEEVKAQSCVHTNLQIVVVQLLVRVGKSCSDTWIAARAVLDPFYAAVALNSRNNVPMTAISEEALQQAEEYAKVYDPDTDDDMLYDDSNYFG